MSQFPPGEPQWVPPPPPPAYDSPFDPRVLAEKEAYIKKNSIIAFVFAVFGFFCCPIVIGVYGYVLANSVLENIEYYNVALDRKWWAIAAKVIAGLGVVIWVIGFIFQYFVL